MRAALLSSYGFCDRPVFEAYPVFELEHGGEPSTLGQAGDFYSLALDELGGASASISGVEQQALSAIGGWTQDAQQAVLGLLGPDNTKLLGVAVQGAQAISAGGGLNEQTFLAVAGLVATDIGGPVAGALVGSMAVSLQAMGNAFLGVAKLLGLAASSPPAVDPRALCGSSGWPFQGQLIPRGPSDTGDGSYQNPGWQSTWHQMQTIIGPSVYCHSADPSAGLSFVRDHLLPKNLNGVLSVADAADLYPWCELMAADQSRDPLGPFLWFFYSLFYTNFDNPYNCNPIPTLDERSLLLKAATVWNAAHSDASTVTLSPSLDWTTAGQPGTTVRLLLGGAFRFGAQAPSLGTLTIHTGDAIVDPNSAAALAAQSAAAGAAAGAAAAAEGEAMRARAAAAAAAGSAPAAPKPPASAGPLLGAAAAGGVGYGLWALLGRPLTAAAFRRGWAAVVAEFF